MTVAGRYGPDNFSDPNGKPVKNTPFEVRQNGVLSDLYLDEDRSAPADNPGMSDALGNIMFYAEPGYHDLTVGETTLSVAVDTIGDSGGGGGSGLTGTTVVTPSGGTANVAAAVAAGATSVTVPSAATTIVMPAVSSTLGQQFTLILYGYSTWGSVTFVDTNDDPINVTLVNHDPVHTTFVWQMSPYALGGGFGWLGNPLNTYYNNPVVTVSRIFYSDDYTGSGTYYNTLTADPGNPGGAGHPPDYAIDEEYTPAEFYDLLGTQGTVALLFAPDSGPKKATLGVDPTITFTAVTPEPDLVAFNDGLAGNLYFGWELIWPAGGNSDGVARLAVENLFTEAQRIDLHIPVTPLADIATTRPTTLLHMHLPEDGGVLTEFIATAVDFGGGFVVRGLGTLVPAYDPETGEVTDTWEMSTFGFLGTDDEGDPLYRRVFRRVESSTPGEMPSIGDIFGSSLAPLSGGTPVLGGDFATKDYTDALVAAGPSPAMFPVAVGQWFASPHEAIYAQATTLNRVMYVPVWIPADVTAVDGIQIEVTTVGAATAVVRLGLYLPHATTMLPDARVIDGGTIDATSGGGVAGVRSLTIASTAVTPNSLAYVSVVSQGATATLRYSNTGLWLLAMGVPSTTNTDVMKNSTGFGWYESSVSGALPATATPTYSSSTAAQVVVGLRRA